MSPDQMFVVAILTLVIPVVSAVVTIIGGIVLFDRQNKKLAAVKDSADKAATTSEEAKVAANHSKEVLSSMQENFKAVVKIIAPAVADQVPPTLPAPSNDQATPLTGHPQTPAFKPGSEKPSVGGK